MVTTSSTSTTEYGLDVGGGAETLSFSDVAARLDEDTSRSEHRISTQETLSHCCRICKEEDTLGNLVELSCNCQGDLSRAHRVCILKWFGVRMWLKRNYTCDLCTVPLHSIKQMVTLAMADVEGRKVLFEEIGAAMDPPGHAGTQALEEAGRNVEENGNPSESIQPRQSSAWSRFRNSNRPYAGLEYACMLVVVIWFFWMVRQFIYCATSNHS